MRIDFHAHILPGMDHGCKDVEMSLHQLQLAAKAKVDVVVATSHFYPHIHTLDGYVEKRAKAEAELRKAIRGKHDLPKVVLGAEVLVCNKLDKMMGLEKLCVEGTNVVLIEFPFSKKWEATLVDTVIRIEKREGLHVVLAHADRYSFDAVMELADAGIQLQLNTDALCSIRKYGLCKRYMKTDNVVALGSDIHGISDGYKKFDRAIRRLGHSGDVILNRTQDIMKNCINHI